MRSAIVLAALLLFAIPALAQQQPSPLDQALKQNLGELVFSNTALLTEVKRLTEENAKLKAQIAEFGRKGEPKPDEPPKP